MQLTNIDSMTALRMLARSNTRLEAAQNQTSTGLRVTSARDDASVFAVSTLIRGEQAATTAVRGSLNSAHGLLSVASAAATTILQRIGDLKAKTIAYNGTQDPNAQKAYLDDIQQLLGDIDQTAGGAEFNGLKPLTPTVPGAAVSFIADTSGTALRVDYKDMTTDGLDLVGFAPVPPDVALEQIDQAFKNATDKLADFAVASREIDAHDKMLDAQSDALAEGLGSLIDADMGRASATLSAEQSREQMAIQALSIANSAPDQFLTLLRGAESR